jgi:hypothetical protein
MRLFNRDEDTGLPNDISIGGLPLFNDDLTMLQQNAFQFGIPSIYKSFSLVLSGCYVDDLNTTTKKLSLTEGYVMIDNIVYYIPRLENQTYPFSIIPGTVSTDSRVFQSGEVKDVTYEYNYAITTSFTFDSNQYSQLSGTNFITTTYTYPYPDELYNNYKQIYFDPFTAQRIEYVQNNFNTDVKLTKLKEGLTVDKTETNKSIIGNSLSMIENFPWNSLKWKYMGYSYLNEFKYLKIMNPNGNYGSTGGSNYVTLTKANIPAHVHNTGTFSISTNSSTQLGNFEVPIMKSTLNYIRATSGAYVFDVNDSRGYNTQHTHTLSGNSGNGTADGLKQTPDAFTVQPEYRAIHYLYRRLPLNYVGKNLYGYLFWDSDYYFPISNM